jgi:hypothetical protein
VDLSNYVEATGRSSMVAGMKIFKNFSLTVLYLQASTRPTHTHCVVYGSVESTLHQQRVNDVKVVDIYTILYARSYMTYSLLNRWLPCII